MNIVTWNDEKSEAYILELLRNSGWTEEQIENRTPEQMELAVNAINKFLMKQAKKRQKTLEKTIKNCFTILAQVDNAQENIKENSDDFSEMCLNLAAMEKARWVLLHKELGDEAMLHILNGLVEDGAFDEELYYEVVNMIPWDMKNEN